MNPARTVVTLLACIAVIAACGSRNDAAPATAAALPSGTPPDATSASAAPTVPAAAVTQHSWSPDALEELLAPIALYPDQLLGQILAASVNSQEVLDGGNWLLGNQSLKGDALDAAAEEAGFGPAMRALVQFPTVVDMMCQQIDWTRQLSSAFTSDQRGVLDAVQRLRAQAAQAGNLKSTPQQKVETKTENDKVVIEVKPASPQVVYVPQYDPQVVYTTPPPPPQTAPATEDTVSTGAAVAGGLLAFGLGVALGSAMHDDDYYPHWSSGAVFYGPRPFYPPAYVYRPAYGPGFHPAYRYAPPPGYRNSYNNVNVNRNVVVNNNNYYNRFTNNQNLRVGQAQSPLAQSRRDVQQDRVTQAAHTARPDNWKGQSTYAGTRNPQAEGARQTPAAPRAQTRGLDEDVARTRATPASENRQSVAGSANTAERIDRGFGDSERGGADAPEPIRTSALEGAGRGENASFDRAASARGHASAGARPARIGARR